MTSPATSSSIAPVVGTVPKCIFVKPLVPGTVNLVPKLVEHRVALAANACGGVALTRLIRANEEATGRQIPVTATLIDKGFALIAEECVARPPS